MAPEAGPNCGGHLWPWLPRLNYPPSFHSCEPAWNWSPPPLLDHDLWYVEDGLGDMLLDGRRYSLAAGSCVVLWPGSRPRATQDPARRLVVFYLHFDLCDSAGAVLQPSPWQNGQVVTVRDTAYFSQTARHCVQSYQRGREDGALRSRVLLASLLLQLREEAIAPPEAAEAGLREAMNAMLREPGRDWTVAAMARQACLSPSQFTRRFRALAGAAPNHFLIRVRLERARQLIRESDMSLAQIAAALGYRDSYFFSRQYKQYMGHAPGRERKSAAVTADGSRPGK